MSDDTSPDVSVDDNVADLPLFGDTTPTDDTVATEETSTTEEQAKDDGSETQEDTETTEESVEANDTEATAEETQQESEQQAEKGKPDPELARQAYLERQRTRQAVTQQIQQQYRPKTEDDLLEEGLDPVDAKIQAIREEFDYREQVNQIAELTTTVRSDVVNVLSDYPIYNPNSPDYDPEFTKMVDDAYDQAAKLQTTEDGAILHAEVLPYEHYQRMAQIYQRGTSRGVKQGQDEATRTMSRTETAGSSSSTTRGNETLEELGERIADVPLF
jgi:hypothetical protein